MSTSYTYKCPNCDGPLLFRPSDQKFHCEYCLSAFTETNLDEIYGNNIPEFSEDNRKEKPVASNSQTNKESVESNSTSKSEEDLEVFNCSNCGAEIVTDATTSATHCYYCHNPVVLAGRISGKYLPDRIIPFRIEKKEVVDNFLSWTKKRWFMPKNFFNKKQIELMTGVYFPYWIVDTKVNGKLRTNGDLINVWRNGDIEHTETKRFDLYRDAEINYKDLIKNALSKNSHQGFVEAVQPYDISQQKAFRSQYFAGFQAEKRDIEFDQINKSVDLELEAYTDNLLKETIRDYSNTYGAKVDFKVESQKADYILLPVWLLTYTKSAKNGDKVYYYAMNGQTGKVAGELPVSYTKIICLALIVFVLVYLGLR